MSWDPHSCLPWGAAVGLAPSVTLGCAQWPSPVWLLLSSDCHRRGSSVHGIFKARVLEWVAISFSRGSSQPRHGMRLSCISYNEGKFYICWAIKEANSTRSQQEPITEWKSSSNPFLLSTLWLLFSSDLAFFSNLGFWSVLFLSPLSVCPSTNPCIHWRIQLVVHSSFQVLPTTYVLSDGLRSVPQMTMLSSEGLGTPCGLFLHHACRGVQGAGRPPAWAPPWVARLHCKPGWPGCSFGPAPPTGFWTHRSGERGGEVPREGNHIPSRFLFFRWGGNLHVTVFFPSCLAVMARPQGFWFFACSKQKPLRVLIKPFFFFFF